MKLSNEKVDQFADALLDVIADDETTLLQAGDAELRAAIRAIIVDELQVEDRLNAEIHQMLQAYKYEITMDRLDYDELYRKLRSRLIAERKLVL